MSQTKDPDKILEYFDEKRLNELNGYCEVCKTHITANNFGFAMSNHSNNYFFICKPCFVAREEMFKQFWGEQNLTKCFRCKKILVSTGAMYKTKIYCHDCSRIVDN